MSEAALSSGRQLLSHTGRALLQSSGDQNWFLIVIVVVVSVACLIGNLYLLAIYQHPDDRNQAIIPKIVVVFGLVLSQLSVLMLPLDRANRAACDASIVLSACNLTLPMYELWYWVYMVMVIVIIFVIPFTMFFYEADSEKNIFARLWEAGQWWFVCVVVFAIILAVCYSLFGYVDYTMQTLNSGLMPVADAYSTLKSAESCIVYGAWDVGNLVNSTIFPSGSGQYLCDSQVGPVRSELWSTTCTFPIYVIALITICGWLLFMVFAGVGFIALPVDLIRTYKNRPMQTITKSEYMRLGQEIGLKAKTTLNKLKAIQLDEKRNGKTRKTKKAAQALLSELTQLEDEDYRLREIYPQSENRADEWAITVLSYFFSGVFGVVSVCLTGCWLAHLVVYEFVVPPLSPMLNEMFVEMDSVFGLFGTAAFAVFCFYLVVCTMKGNLKLGMNFLIFTVHPMKVGDTLMSSFLFNTGLIMLCSISIIQFCSQVFDQYAAETAIDEIFGNQVFNLRGIGYLFRYGAFLYCLFSISMLTMLITPFLRVAKYKPKKNVADDDD